jgi:putative spermidine/putrescine transport system permease protein
MSNKAIDMVASGVTHPKPLTLRKVSFAWVGVLPFFIFVFLFLVLPSMYLFIGSFQNAAGEFTFKNIQDIFTPSIISAYLVTIRISITTALMGGIFGFFLAYALVRGGVPPWVRTGLMTFCGVASNFAGVPLAQAFIFTLGRVGLMTVLLREVFNLDLYDMNFSLYSFWGLSVTYLYFQLPLMVLVIAPAIEGLKPEWREASEILGGSNWHYWRHIAIPVLMPALLGSMILLFGNAFGAYATALSLTGGLINLVTILIGSQIKGDVLHNVNLGYALAFGMVFVMTVTMVGYYLLRRRSERWLKI